MERRRCVGILQAIASRNIDVHIMTRHGLTSCGASKVESDKKYGAFRNPNVITLICLNFQQRKVALRREAVVWRWNIGTIQHANNS